MADFEEIVSNFFNSQNAFTKIISIIAVILLIILLFSSFYIVNPGHRGVLVTLGSVSMDFKNEGLGFKPPFISKIIEFPVKQITAGSNAECYSSDLQQITIT
ncbi:MAG: SPFH domain-containing protein, partial [Fibrobacterota bacterium]